MSKLRLRNTSGRPGSIPINALWGLILPCFLIVAWFSYWSIMNNSPVADDFGHLYKTATVQASQPWKFFTIQSPIFFRPLPFVQIWLFFKIFGLVWWPSHLLNVSMHATSAFLLTWFMLRMRVNPMPAVLAGALFLVTPMAPEAVSWAAGRFDVWALLFMLLSLVLYATALQKSSRRAFIGSLAAAMAAMFSKENAMIMVILLPAMDLLFSPLFRNDDAATGGAWKGILARSSTRIMIMITLFIVYVGARFAIMGRLGGYRNKPFIGMPDINTLPQTAIAMLAPFDLLETERKVILAVAAYIGLLLLISAGIVIYRWRKTSAMMKRLMIFFLTFFIASLLPIYHAVFMGGLTSYLNDSRFFYISMVPLLTLIVLGLFEFGWDSRTWRMVAATAIVILLPVFIWGLNQNNKVWERAAVINYYIPDETQRQLPDPPSGAKLYFRNVPRAEGAHIMASALKESIQLKYDQRDLEVYYVNPDPNLANFFPDKAAESGDGYLFDYDWETGRLSLERGPLLAP